MGKLTTKHIAILYKSVNSIRDRALLTLLLDTGLQLHDISELKLADFNSDNATLTLSDDSGRQFTLQEDTVTSLQKWIENRPKTRDKHLFVTEKGDPRQLSTRGVDYILRQLGKQAELPFALNVTIIKDMVDSKNGDYLTDQTAEPKHDSSVSHIIVSVIAAVFIFPLVIHFFLRYIRDNFPE